MSLRERFAVWRAVRPFDEPVRQLLRQQLAAIFMRHRLPSAHTWNDTVRRAVVQVLDVAVQMNCSAEDISNKLSAFDRLLMRVRDLAQVTIASGPSDRGAFCLRHVTTDELGRLFAEANDLASMSRDYSLAYEPGEFREETVECQGEYDGHHGDSFPQPSIITWTETRTVWSPQRVQLIARDPANTALQPTADGGSS